jgi:hypothetical protein
MTLPIHCELAAVRVLELFGPSSGGKSSLARRLLTDPGEGRVFTLVEDRLLERVGLGWLPGHLARTLAVDALALLALLVTWRAARACYAFAVAHSFGGAGSASLWLRLNLLRNALKAVALRLVAPRFAVPGEVLLMDEGPLQTANYLLVRADGAPDLDALEAFLRVVPLPDAAVYVRLEEETLFRRTLARRHPRVPDGSRRASRRFVRNALAVFDRIASEPRVAERLLLPGALVSPEPAVQDVAS